MRGQATSIQHSHQRSLKLQQQKCLGQAILPTSNPSTNSGRLSHHTVSQGLVSDVSGLNPKHLDASRHIFSSQCIQNRHQFLRMMQTFFLQKDIPALTRQRRSVRAPNSWRRAIALYCLPIRSPMQAQRAVGHHWPARAKRSGKAATASAHNHTNRVPRLVELSGIEPLTPCLQSRCSPS
ncbi:hypothetical protein QOV31_003654 [Agrobacterium fabrum]|nr:hypothetical protein QOV31_002393 [Agrobacterium fabrum]WJK75847.1 hypothetical protein QOV31_002730 [Agrobacterium fabrum]WJK76770.1 hypothetical protein QOV31_003654 [Agrobacterium fabrum]